jgi:hypothetical protein
MTDSTFPPLRFTVISVAVHSPPIEAAGARLMAHMTVQYGAIVVVGAVLTQYEATGDIRVKMPMSGRNRRTTVRDPEAAQQLLEAALAAYRALGGNIAATPVAKALPGSEILCDTQRN